MGKREQAAGVPRSGLGTNAKLRTPPAVAALGERLKAETEAFTAAAARLRRYALQRHISLLLKDFRRVNRNGEEVPYRVFGCMWEARQGCAEVVKTSRGATFRGLQTCGSIWHCPVCAARISNERRRDIKAAVDAAAALGYKALLLTLTARHTARTSLPGQLKAMTKAYEAMWRGAPAERIKARAGILGMIRSLEATHSRRNGWHPHIHVIIFVPEGCDVAALGDALRSRWEHCAARHGLSMNEHGFDLIDDTARVADYVAKYGHEPRWQSADELARWHTKVGRGGRGQWEHFTPWQLAEFSMGGDEQAGALFQEYALTFHGRRQIVWSDGLRDLLGLGEEATDEEAAEKEMEEAAELLRVVLTAPQWEQVRRWKIDLETGEVLAEKKKWRDRRAELLEVVERCADLAELAGEIARLFGFTPAIFVDQAERSDDQADDQAEGPDSSGA